MTLIKEEVSENQVKFLEINENENTMYFPWN